MEWKNLFDICNPKQWKTLVGKDLLNEGYPVYGAGAIIGYWNKYSHEDKTLIIGCRGSCGNLRITKKKSYINGNAMALDDLKSDIVDIKFLYYYLLNRGLKDTITGGVQKQITRQTLKKVEIALPEMEIQKKIVEVLDKIQTIICTRKEQIKLLDDLIESTFYDMFSSNNIQKYKLISLSNLCTDIYDCPHSTPEYSSLRTDYKCLKTSNLKNGYIGWGNLSYVSKKVYEERTKRYLPQVGDVVYSREGAILGIAAIVNKKDQFCLGQRLMIFSLDKSKVTSEFFWMIMNSNFVSRQVELNIGGAAAPRINIKDIKNFQVYLPPIDLQTQFAEIVQKIVSQKQLMEKSLEEMENNYNGLMQRAFKGELFS